MFSLITYLLLFVFFTIYFVYITELMSAAAASAGPVVRVCFVVSVPVCVCVSIVSACVCVRNFKVSQIVAVSSVLLHN